MAGVLGQTVAAPDEYTPSVLERIDRRLGRDGIENPSENVGSGYDVWHCYELSWTLPDGAVTFTTGALIIPADSPFTVESKSFKLYLWSYRNEGHYHEDVTNRILADLVAATEPVWMEVRGEFNIRGGIATTVTARHGKRPDGLEDIERAPLI